jgi:hypothetical protein
MLKVSIKNTKNKAETFLRKRWPHHNLKKHRTLPATVSARNTKSVEDNPTTQMPGRYSLALFPFPSQSPTYPIHSLWVLWPSLHQQKVCDSYKRPVRSLLRCPTSAELREGLSQTPLKFTPYPWNILPSLLLVSMGRLVADKVTPVLFKSQMIFWSSWVNLANLSTWVTTSSSPSHRNSNGVLRSSRPWTDAPPNTFSYRIVLHPPLVSASTWMDGLWSLVDTLVYPYFIIHLQTCLTGVTTPETFDWDTLNIRKVEI